ncbi:lipoyl protein ligase domain-containing protein [Marivita sp. S0852]|uniref:lipoyl protein ligase domain-containing protein n=1 Tax=Marivita sp. S0852 TaxID=3373893 RepID=UPI00398200A4
MIQIETLSADDAMNREAALLAEVSEDPTKRQIWFWQSPQCLIAPRKLSRVPGYDAVTRVLAKDGWPVALRSTGGDVTPQGNGIINVTHVYARPPKEKFDLDREYNRLCSPIEAALGDGATRGWQPGAFCDGAHNVQWNGLKFAGTAMRFRPCKADKTRYAVLAHALMLIAPPDAKAIEALNIFLTALNQDRQIDPAAHTGLPSGMQTDSFLERVKRGFDNAG